MKRHALIFSLLFAFVHSAEAEAPKFIDTQAQFDTQVDSNFKASLEIMLNEMDRVGKSKTCCMGRSKWWMQE